MLDSSSTIKMLATTLLPPMRIDSKAFLGPAQNGEPRKGRPLRSTAMDEPRCRHPSRFKRLIAVLHRRCAQTVPKSWLDEPPADPDIGVREPRRPQPHGGAGSVLLEPPL
jgi:hypothetical protein